MDARSMLRDLGFNFACETAPEVRMPEVFGGARCKARIQAFLDERQSVLAVCQNA